MQEERAIEKENCVDTHTVKCDGCGSNMCFDPEGQVMKCSHCGLTKAFNMNDGAFEIDLRTSLNSRAQWSTEETVVFACDNCGAKVVMELNATAKSCPFCGTAHVKNSEDLAGIKPNAVLPPVA